MENQNIKNDAAKSDENLVLDTEGGAMPDPSRVIKEKAQNAAEVFEKNEKGKPQPDRQRKQQSEKKAG
jgi:hypothetical protein